MRASLLFLLLLATSNGRGDLASDYRFFDVRSGEPVAIAPVIPENVAGFELFYATPGSGDISEIAGHLLLRIKLKDSQDLVVSFLADTDSEHRTNTSVVVQENCRQRNWFNIVQTPDGGEPAWFSIWQSLKGLAGGFEVVMDIQTLDHTLKSYTVEQDRNLWRFELMLTEDMERSLLQHLEEVQAEPGPPYYFFSQNCGSVLVQVVGEGIGHKEIAEFQPWVSPPHSLVALLLRTGIAKPVAPHFHSFRRRGHLFRERFQEVYSNMGESHPRSDWPPVSAFFSTKEQRREAAVYALAISGREPETLDLLGSLIQEMEMAFDDKDRPCSDYTSAATAAAREMQKNLRRNASLPVQDMRAELEQVPEYYALAKGTDHTGLFTFTPGAAYLDGRFAVAFEGALLKQEMGSRSKIAMQRAGALELGGLSVVDNLQGTTEWRITGLRLEKFRETLNSVPSCLRSTRGVGLGLRLLDAERLKVTGDTRMRWGGISGLANLYASENFDSFIYASAGLEFTHLRDHGFEWPLRIESLITTGPFQWRTRTELLMSSLGQTSDELRSETGIDVLIGEANGTEYSLRATADYHALLEGTEEDRWLGKLSIEFRNW